MSGREVREYTNLSDPKDRKLGKGKDKIDDEDITFQRMVAKGFWLYSAIDSNRCKKLLVRGEDIFMGEEVFHSSFYWDIHAASLLTLLYILLLSSSALDSDDLLYLKEQMEAEEDAERLLRRTEKRAFAAFKKAAILADSTPAIPAALRVEPKPKSDIRQQDLLKNIVGIKPKRAKVSSPSQPAGSNTLKHDQVDSVTTQSSSQNQSVPVSDEKESPCGIVSARDTMSKSVERTEAKQQNTVASLLGLAYDSSDEE